MRRPVVRGFGMLTALAVVLLGIASAGADAPQHVAYLPVMHQPAGCGELAIFDLDGELQDWAWLTETFGDVRLVRGNGTACVSELRAIEGPATLVVDVGEAGIPVVFHWSGAPILPVELRACGLDRGLVVWSESDGTADFAMGGGSYYFPPAGGPHVMWVGGVADPDCLGGLGMLGGTNHVHLDTVVVLGSR